MEHFSAVALWIAFLLYVGAFGVFVVHLAARRNSMNRIGMMLVVAAWVVQTASLATRGIAAGHFPVVGAYESLNAVAWSIAVVYLVLESFTRVKAIGLYVMPVVVALLIGALVAFEAPRAVMPALRSDVVVVHVAVMLTAVGALYVAGGAALIYLIESWLLKRHALGTVLGRLPSLATLDKLVYHATLLGLPFLTMGMAAGVIRAETFKVASWWTDPMVVLAIGAWLVYVLLVWGRARAAWGGRHTAYLAVIGLVMLLAIRFAAVPFLSAFHTYGG